MNHDISLISTIAAGLGYACILGFVAIRLRLPPLVGYLAAGIVLGPFTPGFMADPHLAPQLAEIGVILLMFGVGMHLDPRDLLAVRRIAIPGALAQIIAATGIGVAIAFAWGWGIGGGLVLGLALSVASTVVLLRALEQHGMLDAEIGRIAVGWLLVEDLVTVLALVMLPAIAPLMGGHVPDTQPSVMLALGVTLAKAAAFIGVMLVVGARLFPWVLDRIVRTGSRELFTLAVISVALGLGLAAAEAFGLSFALGAFFAGLTVRASGHGKRAQADTQPLQDAFAALFFVSVGMMFDPHVLLTDPVHVLVVLGVILVAKPLIAWAIMRGFGQGNRAAFTVAAGLGQIGEFSFILASLGVELGLLPQKGQQLILAGALLAILANPFLVRAAGTLGVRTVLGLPAAS